MCPVKIFNENIAWTKETQYLGVTVDSKLTYSTHLPRILHQANYRLRQLFPILNQSSTIDINLALIIYKSLLRSKWTYACPVWGYAAYTYINKLQTFQNKVLRIIPKLPRVTPIATLHEQTGMSLIRSHITKLAKTVRFRNWDNTTPSLINNCVPYPSVLRNPLGTANSHYNYPNIFTVPQPLYRTKVKTEDVFTGIHAPGKIQSGGCLTNCLS
jgi:hypothetical protein